MSQDECKPPDLNVTAASTGDAAAAAPRTATSSSWPGTGGTLTTRTLLTYLFVLAGATLAVLLLCSLFGQVSIWTEGVWELRLKRLANAALVGAALSSAGMALQGMLRNPLAEPYILGVSSGAGIGVMLSFVVAGMLHVGNFLSWLSMPVLAMAGALATSAAVYAIAQRRGRLDPYVLLLSGVIVNAFNGAIMLTLYLILPEKQIANFATWAMGYISETTGPGLFIFALLAVLTGWGGLLMRGASFNMLGLGDDVAASGGVHVHYLRAETFVLVSLMTAAAVALSGPIGFVGLIVPHICRSIVGPDHRRLALVCGFAGAMLVMIGDTICNTITPWIGVGILPVGILMALSGGPFFIYLLRKRRARVEA